MNSHSTTMIPMNNLAAQLHQIGLRAPPLTWTTFSREPLRLAGPRICSWNNWRMRKLRSAKAAAWSGGYGCRGSSVSNPWRTTNGLGRPRSNGMSLNASGADVKHAQAQMGHSRSSTTLDIYQQFVSESQQRAVDRLSRLVN
jgi:hypothetical protein